MLNFADNNPILLKEWNYEKNDKLGFNPNEMALHSNKKVWWICPICDHEYFATINNRVNGTACPKCANEMKTSFGEQAIYFYLNKLFGAENRWNQIGYEADIFISCLNLAIEYDGELYHRGKNSDRRETEKYEELRRNTITLIRVKENYKRIKLNNSASYTIEINDRNYDKSIPRLIDQLLTIIYSIYGKGIEEVLKNKLDVNIKRDRQLIYQQYIVQRKENSIEYKYPELLKEWDYDKNFIKPRSLTLGSNKKVWWKCSLGHSYEQSVNTHKKSGCPYCSSQKVLSGFNDLKTKYPEIAKEWDYKKNKIGPENVLPFSNKNYYWICNNNHSYIAKPSKKCREEEPTKCPICSNKKILVGFNDLKTKYPEIAKEWDYNKNKKRPEDYFVGSGYKAWWICTKGHSYNSYIYSRTGYKKAKCPICANKKILEGYNDLKTLRPDLLLDWDYKKNSLKPEEVVLGSNKKVHWKCHLCGHEWISSPSCRCYTEQGCKSCSMKKAWEKRKTFK